MRLYRSPVDGVVFLVNEGTKTRYRLDPAEIPSLTKIYGSVIDAAEGQLSIRAGFVEGPRASTVFGGISGMEAVASGDKVNPFSWGAKPIGSPSHIEGKAPQDAKFMYGSGEYWLVTSDGTRHHARNQAQVDALYKLYGVPQVSTKQQIEASTHKASGVLDYFGFQSVEQLEQLESPFPDTTPPNDVGRSFVDEARRRYPHMPEELLQVYADKWQETGDAALAMEEVRESPRYEVYFPGNRKQNGQLAMSEADYMTYRDRVTQMMRSVGMPEGFYDEPEDFAEFVNRGLSLQEIQSRIMEGWTAMQFAPSDVRETFAQYYGPNSDAALASYFIDPDRAEKVILQHVTAAQIGATARRTGFGDLSQGQSERLAGLGVDPGQAVDQFSAMAMQRQIFGQLPGEVQPGVSQEEALGAVFEGDSQSRERIRRRQEGRVSKFQGGGSAITAESGIAGLRSATN